MVDVRTGRISEPVHRSVKFTGLEKFLLDHPVAQRLRNIAQSGLVHYVFPEVRTSRFSHCLGTMHFASRFLSACLQNTTNEPFRERVITDLIAATRLTPNFSFGEEDDRRRIVADGRILLAHAHCSTSAHDAMVVVEQALRLAAFFHDLGHLPFSHDFEYAFDDLRRRLPDGHPYEEDIRNITFPREGAPREAIHERLGHELARVLLRTVQSARQPIESQSTGTRVTGDQATNRAERGYIGRVFSLAFAILDAHPPEDERTAGQDPRQRALYWLHSLIDGEIDADRCDYLLRDGRNYGFDFAPYNVEFLLDNLVVIPSPHNQNRYVLAVKSQGMSAAESFFLSRYRSTESGVRHHKVAQIEAALRFSIVEMILDSLSPNPSARAESIAVSIREFIENLSSIVMLRQDVGVEGADPILLDKFATYDEVWWTQLMRQYLGRQEDSWLGLVCWRRRGPRSLWKRAKDFDRALREAGFDPPGSPGVGHVEAWNTRLAVFSSKSNGAATVWAELENDLRDQDVLIVRHSFNPFGVDQPTGHIKLYVHDETDILEPTTPLTELSATTRGLQQSWREAVQVHAFTTHVAGTPEEATGQIRMVINRITAAVEQAETVVAQEQVAAERGAGK
jgi:HD superfamily phosphohydrolase